MAAVGEQRITYDARGLAEPHAEAPRTAKVADGKATFDAHDLSTRQINLELRRLLYEEGITDVTVQNPGAKHSIGVGILTRCKITFDGSLGYFGCGLIDGPEIQINGPRRLVGLREHDVRRRRGRRATRARSPVRRSAAATSSSRARSARVPGSTRRAGPSSSWAMPAR